MTASLGGEGGGISQAITTAQISPPAFQQGCHHTGTNISVEKAFFKICISTKKPYRRSCWGFFFFPFLSFFFYSPNQRSFEIDTVWEK